MLRKNLLLQYPKHSTRNKCPRVSKFHRHHQLSTTKKNMQLTLMLVCMCRHPLCYYININDCLHQNHHSTVLKFGQLLIIQALCRGTNSYKDLVEFIILAMGHFYLLIRKINQGYSILNMSKVYLPNYHPGVLRLAWLHFLHTEKDIL